MLILIRQYRVRGEDIVDQRDMELDAKAVRAGSGMDQDLQLPGETISLAHALIQPRSNNRLRIECKGRNRFEFNGKRVRRADLALGEVARIGGHSISATSAPPGFDAAIEARIDADATQPVAQRFRNELTLKLPRLRAISYALVLLIAALGLGLPLLGYYNGEARTVIDEFNGPSDKLWSSGSLADAHHLPTVIKDCNTCHAKPFERVTNQACLQCHEKTTAHFSASHPINDEFQGSCRACHEEHNEPSTLIVRHKALCTDCHENQLQRLPNATSPIGLAVASAPAELPSVTGFSVNEHPEFLASVLRLSESKWDLQRLRLGTPETRESSNLKFPHELHLNVEKVSSLDAGDTPERALVCNDCHQLERQGEHFQPITMESTCIGCHTLAFDDVQPDRQLPHGEPESLRTHLEEFYVKQAAQQKRSKPREAARRVPNAPVQTQRCQKNPLDCGIEWADAQMDRLFTKAGCVSCHEVYRGDDDWQVQPVRLVEDWFPGARFDHVPHLIPDASEDGNGKNDAICEGCHQATTSSESHDVLMPGIKTCLGCHAETRDEGVVLQCIDCHGFHRPGQPPMGDAHP